MKKSLEGIKPKTSICVHVTTLNRLKSYMKYGDTVNGMVDNLMDFYDKYKDAVSKLEGEHNGS